MKRGFSLITLLMGFLLLTGMGDIGGTPGGTSPTPEKEFSATFIDRQDITTQCTRVSRNGKVFIVGKKGRGTVAVPFERIKEVEFVNRNDMVTAIILLTNGKSVEIQVDKSQIFYGHTDFGSFHIELVDLKKIVFKH